MNRRNIRDVREILNHIRAGSSDRQIARDLKIDRRTVERYWEWAEEQGLWEVTLPAHPPPHNVSSVEPYREVVARLVKENVEVFAIWCRLMERGDTGGTSRDKRLPYSRGFGAGVLCLIGDTVGGVITPAF